MRAGKIGFDEAGDDVDGGPLGGEDEMDADGAGHLSESRDGFFDVGGVDHHEVGQLVDDNDHVGKRLVLFLVDIFKERERLRFLEGLVVLVDIADAALGQEFEAALHFAGGVAKHVGSDFGIGDHGREEVRDVFVEAELEALWVDEDEFELFGSGFEEQADEERIEKDALAGAGGTGDEQVGHLS